MGKKQTEHTFVQGKVLSICGRLDDGVRPSGWIQKVTQMAGGLEIPNLATGRTRHTHIWSELTPLETRKEERGH